MTALAEFFANTLGQYLPAEWVCFFISMIPLIELRGGLIAASLLKVPFVKAVIFCIIGNIIPIPFILLFIKKILRWMKNIHFLKIDKFAEWLEKRAGKKSEALKKGEFLGLMLFVGIPIPGTGAWMGSLMAALFDIKIPKAVIAELCGLILATVIMSLLSYGALGSVFHFFG